MFTFTETKHISMEESEHEKEAALAHAKRISFLIGVTTGMFVSYLIVFTN